MPEDKLLERLEQKAKGRVILADEAGSATKRKKIFLLTQSAGFALHEQLAEYKRFHGGAPDSPEVRTFERTTGLYLLESPRKSPEVSGLEVGNGKYTFEVHSVRGARRIAPDGRALNQVIISITQKRMVPGANAGDPKFRFRGGCTLILDLQDLTLEYAIVKTIGDKVDKNGKLLEENPRLLRQRKYRQSGERMSLRETYFGASGQDGADEPFALLHSSF